MDGRGPDLIIATDDAIADPDAVARFRSSQEAIAFDHEHGRLSQALKTAEERAELVGHDDIALELRRLRATVARHIVERRCGT